MTKIEFIHQAIIGMASKLVDSTGSIDGAYRSNIVTEACKLAEEAEKHGCYFDDENINTSLENIDSSLEKINDTLETIEEDLCGENGCGDGAINSIATNLEKLDDIYDILKTHSNVYAMT